jgi:hypothetical protein
MNSVILLCACPARALLSMSVSSNDHGSVKEKYNEPKIISVVLQWE